MAWLDIKGHKNAIDFLVNAARKNRLAHSYLFLGTQGIGKKLLAKEFAKFLLCETPQDQGACGQCRSCIQCNADNHPDVHIISKGRLEWVKIDEIRKFAQQMYLSPFSSKRKIFIIDNVQMLTQEAANSLLKLMEEPPPATLSILITNNIDSLPQTLISRCQQLYFSPLSFKEMEQVLADMIAETKEFIHFLARFSEGRLGRAISLLKRKDIQADKNRLLHNIIDNKLDLDDFAVNLNRENLETAIEFMLLFFRDVLLIKAGLEQDFLINIDEVDTLRALAESLEICDIEASLDHILQAQSLIRTNVNSKILLSWLAGQLQQRLRLNYVR